MADALALTPEQNAAVTFRGGALLCSAAAGAGKTRVLVERLMGHVRDPESPAHADDFLLLTFTRAAAGEMRERILERLRALCHENPRDGHLRAQLTRVYTAKICTLDAYCREILMENAAAAGLLSGFRIGDASEMALLEETALDETLDSLYEACGDQPEAPFSLLCDAFGDVRGDTALSSLILELWRKTRCHPGPEGFLKEQPGRLETGLPGWCAALLRGALDIAAAWRGPYARMKPELERDDIAAAYLRNWEEDMAGMDALARAGAAGWDEAALFLEGYAFSRLASIKNERKTPACACFADLREGWKKTFARLRDKISGPLARHRADLEALRPLMAGLVTAAEAFDRTLRELKERRGVLDFSDVEHKTYHLLTKNGAPNALAERYAARFREIMVDEYQDINPLQNALIDALSQKGGNIFYVGDARQSIYRFQMADPSLFLQKLKSAHTVLLRENFRSRPGILNAVNHVFARIDCPETGRLPEKAFMVSGRASQDPPRSAPVEILRCRRDGDEASASAEARAVAARLRALIDSGEARPRDCVILLRSPGPRTAYFRRALEAVGLGCAAPGGTFYFERPEIITALSALQTADNPYNDIALLSVLRSPMVGMTPGELANLRLLCPEGPLCDCLPLDGSPKARAFAEQLSRWRALAADLPPYELCARIMAETALPGRYEGAARSNLLVLPQALLGYPGAELRNFCLWLEKNGETAAPGPSLGAETAGAVEIMSIHKAKGLEFPVVAVAGLNSRFNMEDMKGRLLIHPQMGLGLCCRDAFSEYPSIAHKAVRAALDSEMRSEELRLLYVAMTRAEKKLILSVGGEWEEAPRGFVGRGDFALSAKVSDWLLHVRDENWAVWTDNGEQIPAGSEQTADNGEQIPAGSGTAGGAPALMPYPYQGAVDFPSKITATGLPAAPPPPPAEKTPPLFPAGRGAVRMPRLSAAADPPLTAAERGSALHLFMQLARYERCVSQEGARAERDRLLEEGFLTLSQARSIDFSPVTAFFAGETGQRLLSAKNPRREQKFSLLASADELPGAAIPPGEKVLLQGAIDCWYETPEGICILDFKTGFAPPGREAAFAERYRPQLDVYAAALRAIYPGKNILSREIVFLAAGKTVAL